MRLAAGAVIAGAVLVAASVRLVGEGRAELAASDAAFRQGDVVTAAVHARSAVRAHVPFATHMEEGSLKLREMAKKSERRGDSESALFAWRALLSAASGTRPFSAVSDEERADAEASVARLSAEILASAQAGSVVKREPRAESDVTARDLVPRIGWAALLLTGACLWWGAGLVITSGGWGADGRIASREVRLAVVMASAGLLAWVAGLLLG